MGASFDTVEDQKTFAEAESFPYKLIADTDKSVGKLYQAERTPDMPMHEYGIPRRITYLIDPEGVIRKTFDLDAGEHDLSEHASECLEAIQELSG